MKFKDKPQNPKIKIYCLKSKKKSLNELPQYKTKIFSFHEIVLKLLFYYKSVHSY